MLKLKYATKENYDFLCSLLETTMKKHYNNRKNNIGI
jgi:hypothetical protein